MLQVVGEEAHRVVAIVERVCVVGVVTACPRLCVPVGVFSTAGAPCMRRRLQYTAFVVVSDDCHTM